MINMYLLYICDSLYIYVLTCLLSPAYKYVSLSNKSSVSVQTLCTSLVVNLVPGLYCFRGYNINNHLICFEANNKYVFMC